MLVGAFKALLERSKLDPALVEDIAVGSVLPPGGGATEFRAAALAAGFPVSAAVRSLNRQCSSGLQACVDIANAIQSGMIEIGVGAGVESMSLQYGYASSFSLFSSFFFSSFLFFFFSSSSSFSDHLRVEGKDPGSRTKC